MEAGGAIKRAAEAGDEVKVLLPAECFSPLSNSGLSYEQIQSTS